MHLSVRFEPDSDFYIGHWIAHDLLKSLNQVTDPAPSYFAAVTKM